MKIWIDEKADFFKFVLRENESEISLEAKDTSVGFSFEDKEDLVNFVEDFVTGALDEKEIKKLQSYLDKYIKDKELQKEKFKRLSKKDLERIEKIKYKNSIFK